MKNENYTVIRKLTKEILRNYYETIEKDLEEIINAPSLLARVCNYYHIARRCEDYVYLVFYHNDKITFVKEYYLKDFSRSILLKNMVELYYNTGIHLAPIEPIMYQGD